MRQHRQEAPRALRWMWPCLSTLALFLLAGTVAMSTAQIPKSAPAKAEPAAPVDPLRRETPRRSVEGLLRCSEREDFACVARYLQPPLDRQMDMLEVARESQALRTRYKGSIAALSDDPDGRVEEGLLPGQERAGVVKVGGTTTELILTRVDDPKYGKIWLVSSETVAKIPQLYAELQNEKPTLFERITPAALAYRVC